MLTASKPSSRLPLALHVARLGLALLLAARLAPGAAAAQALDPNMWTTNGSVYAIASAGDTIYLGGGFTSVGPNTGCYVAVDQATGARQPGWPRVNGYVRCSVADGAGGWYIGGLFTSVGGVARGNLAHIRADRTLDGWNPSTNNWVRTLARSGSTVYAGGEFTTVGGEARGHLVALDAKTGVAAPWNPAADSIVRTVVVDGPTLYVGGFFSSIGGQERHFLAAFDASSGLVTAWNPGADNAVRTLLVHGGTVYAGGDFTQAGGGAREHVAALDSITGIATAWNPGADGTVWTLARDGRTIYAGGQFTRAGGVDRSGLAAIDLDTGLPSAWNPRLNPGGYALAIAVSGPLVYAGGLFSAVGGVDRSNFAAIDVGTGIATAWNPATDSWVGSILLTGSSVMTGGAFSTIGVVTRRNLAALDARTGQALDWNPGADGLVRTLAVDGATVYAGGDFSVVGGVNRNSVAALDAASGHATAWNPDASGDAYRSIHALLVRGSIVYAGGVYNHIGGQDRTSLAALDAQTGLATDWSPVVAGTGYSPQALVSALRSSGNRLYVGGSFGSINGLYRSNLAAFDAPTGNLAAWNPGIGGSLYQQTSVRAIAIADTAVYVGGVFSGAGGAVRANVVALDPVTGLARGWNPGAIGDRTYLSVNALSIDATGVYVGGWFSVMGGQLRSNLARIDTATGNAGSWNPGVGNGNEGPGVFALSLKGATTYVGGEFFTVCGMSCRGFAALRPDAHAPTVRVLSPNGSVPLMSGTQRQLQWSASDDDAVQSVDLYLSRTGPAGPWELLAAAVPNIGTYLWGVTGPEVAGNDAYLMVAARDFAGHVGTDISNSGFGISSNLTGTDPRAPVLLLALAPPAPNPARGRSLLAFAVPARMPLRLTLFDIQGREVAVLADGIHEAGRHTATIDATTLGPGIYFARLQASGRALMRRLVVTR